MKLRMKLLITLLVFLLGIGTFISTALACSCYEPGGSCGPANCCGCGSETSECTDCDLDTQKCKSGEENEGKDGFADCEDKSC